MVTSLQINDKLLEEALALSQHSTANLLIETALKEYIQRRKQLQILELFSTIDYEEDYDYKQQRNSR
ncbi:MAG: type II toxin-antitoxin system VapB family antitoxin [Cyanobacteria bacterium SBLK]|nr:type II toxin-antitoxin system VapB family antitoxin [Cyanobacteria bacterium SBLK]